MAAAESTVTERSAMDTSSLGPNDIVTRLTVAHQTNDIVTLSSILKE